MTAHPHAVKFSRKDDGTWRAAVPLRGRDLLGHPMINKGSVFSAVEREAFGLEGLLPSHIATYEEQAQRAYQSIMRKSDPLERYIGMSALQDRNETLFFKVLLDHIEELMPIVYTPTVGAACQSFSHIFRRARGVWITPEHRGRIAGVLANAEYDDVRLIVVTDNERILGLGDQGAGGMGIPVGKLSLYSAGAGIHPMHTLPISLDVGTDNQSLLDDPLYVGYRAERLRGALYHEFVDEFVHAVKKRFPQALLQWEDFKKGNAIALLEKYRHTLPSFNDDIQGTAAVAVAAVCSAALIAETPLREQRIVVVGAGAAGVGIAKLLRSMLETEGVEGDALIRAIAVLDSRGMLVDDRELFDQYKQAFAWPAAMAAEAGVEDRSLLGVVRALKPTVLIGTSGQTGVFNEELVRTMADGCERPAIFPFSNPTSKSEAVPRDLAEWTGGRALVATGSPFEPFDFEGRTITTSQGNNVWVFPGLGLGCLVAGCKRVPDELFAVAAVTVAQHTSDEDRARGLLLPPLGELRAVSQRIAEAVVKRALELGIAAGPVADDAVRQAMWQPEYPELLAV